jgi:hypothetical protein
MRIIIKLITRRICLLIDVAIPTNKNVIQKGGWEEIQKFKYKNISI